MLPSCMVPTPAKLTPATNMQACNIPSPVYQDLMHWAELHWQAHAIGSIYSYQARLRLMFEVIRLLRRLSQDCEGHLAARFRVQLLILSWAILNLQGISKQIGISIMLRKQQQAERELSVVT